MRNNTKTFKSIILFSLMLISISCSKSTRSIITTGDEWIGSKTEIIDEYNKGSRLVFTENSFKYLDDNTSLDINWLNEYSFSYIDTDGKKKVMFFRKVSENKFEIAYLWESDYPPKNNKDWDKLRFDGSTSYLIRKEAKTDKMTQKFYKVGAKSVPVDKVPPAGLYAYKNERGETYALINVIIENEVVKFQTGEKKSSLLDEAVEMSEVGGIYFSQYGSSQYIGNGIIENSGLMFNGNSGGTVKFIREPSSNNNK
jgi:hypothetical protein